MSIKEKRQEELLKKLFKNIVGNIPELKNLTTIIKITKNPFKKANGYWFTKDIIELNLLTIKNRTKQGYEADYYRNRDKKINPYILNNRHNVYRFILLHELGHALDCFNCKNVIYYRNKSTYEKESFADKFALNKLKEVK